MWFCALLLTSPALLVAQLNFKVGYTASFFNLEANDGILERFNAARPYLDDVWDPVGFINGVDLGLAFQSDLIGLEAGYELKFGQRSAEGIPPGATESFQDRVFYNLQGFYVGGKVGYEILFAGVNLMQNRLQMSFLNDDLDDRLTILRDNYQSLQFYLSLEPNPDDPFRFSIRPFVEIPVGNVNLREAAEFLEPDFAADAPADFYEERWVQYGIRIVFLNGR